VRVKLTKLLAKNLLRPSACARCCTVLGGRERDDAARAGRELERGLDARSAVSGGAHADRVPLNRYCPQTSYLPEWYGRRIEKIDGVESVLPVKVYLNNCRASLDRGRFNGVPVDKARRAQARARRRRLRALRTRADSALVGDAFAQRTRLEVGDQFRFGDINVKVAASSSRRADRGRRRAHAPRVLQRAVAVNRLGTVTQFEVKSRRRLARAARSPSRSTTCSAPRPSRPTRGRRSCSSKRATRDLREILRFARCSASRASRWCSRWSATR
jgi:putative ABC transport system permease protein